MGKTTLRLDPMVDPASAQKRLLAFELMVFTMGKKAILESVLKEVPKGKKRLRKKRAKIILAHWVGQELHKIGYRPVCSN